MFHPFGGMESSYASDCIHSDVEPELVEELQTQMKVRRAKEPLEIRSSS